MGVPPVATEYHLKVPAEPYEADTDVVPVVHIVLLVTVGAASVADTLAVTAVRADTQVPSVNST